MQYPGQRWLSVVCVLIALHFTIAYLTLTNPMVLLMPLDARFATGGPFAYRMLPAMLWSVALRISPHMPHHAWPALNPPFESAITSFMALMSFLSILGAMLVMRRTIRFACPPWAEWFAPLLGILAYFDLILPLHRNLWYPYDATAIFFFALLIDAAYRNRPWFFALTIPFAMLNKETAIMTVIAYAAFQFTRIELRRLATLCVALGAIAMAVREMQKVWILHTCIAATCETGTQQHLLFNLKQLVNPLFWASFPGIFGFSWVLLILLYKDIPAAIRRAFLWVGIPWMAAMLWSGVLRELRIFSELSVLVVLALATGTVNALARNRQKCEDAPVI